MQKKIIHRPYQIASELSHLSPLLQRIYAARGIENTTQLEHSLKSLLPFDQLTGIAAATELLSTVLSQQKHIMIIGDYDADGATSSALAIRALKQFGAEKVSYLVPNRFDFGYGLTPELVKLANQQQPDVLITVDNGIASVAGVEAANQLGMQVLITDHHLPGEQLPAAVAIVNPNQAACSFPSKSLAGVGVIFYVMLALRAKLRQQNWFEQQGLAEPNMAEFLDLVALGTVADIVPLDSNNRIMVYQGLQRIAAGQCCPAIQALLQLGKRSPQRLTASDLAFAVAPRLNAAGRLEDMSLGIECLLSDDPDQAYQLALRLHQLNEERRNIENDMQQQALSMLEKLHFDGDLPYGLCLFDASWHQGVIGILASRIKNKVHRPVIVFAPDGEDGIKGSARSINGVHIRDILAQIDAQHPGLITKFGGHAMAAGLSLKRNQFDRFQKLFLEALQQSMSEEDLEASLLTDGELKSDELSLDTCEILRQAGPWGQGFAEPSFDGVFEVIEQRLVGEKHLKLNLKKNGYHYDAIAFYVDTQQWPDHRCQQLKVVYKPDINEYLGQRRLQLLIDYLEPVR